MVAGTMPYWAYGARTSNAIMESVMFWNFAFFSSRFIRRRYEGIDA